MDPRALKQRFGERLCFEGGVSVETTLPFGTPEDVRQEVEARSGSQCWARAAAISSVRRTRSKQARRSPFGGTLWQCTYLLNHWGSCGSEWHSDLLSPPAY
jgi:hypothetical protein